MTLSSASIGGIYTRAVAKNLRPFFANWDPSQPIELGTYGELRQKMFLPLGNIREFSLSFSTQTTNGETTRQFESSGSAEIAFSSRATAPTGEIVNASVALDFKKKDSVFFNIAGCRYTAIKNPGILARAIMDLWRSKNSAWNRSWVVVTDLVHSRSTTILISRTSNAKAVLEAEGRVAQVDLANAAINLHVCSKKHLGYHLVGEQGITPLFRLSKIQFRIEKMGRDFSPRVAGLITRDSERTYYFGEITQ